MPNTFQTKDRSILLITLGFGELEESPKPIKAKLREIPCKIFVVALSATWQSSLLSSLSLT